MDRINLLDVDSYLVYITYWLRRYQIVQITRILNNIY